MCRTVQLSVGTASLKRAQGVTIEEVLAQLHLVGSNAPGGGFDEAGLARLLAGMEADHPADGDSTGLAEPAPK